MLGLTVDSFCATRGRGWDAEGVEPSPVLGELAREKFGLKVKTGALESAAFPDESFDVITLLDVIEHLHDVRTMLKEIRRIIKPDGVFFIKTPKRHVQLLQAHCLSQSTAPP